MNINDITKELDQIKILLNAHRNADADEKVYNLGDYLGWNENKTGFLYERIYQEKGEIEPSSLLPGGSFNFDYELVKNNDWRPL